MQVLQLKLKISWKSEAKEYHRVTPHNSPHTRDLLGETQGGWGCRCLDWPEAAKSWVGGRFYILFVVGAELSGVGIDGISGWALGLVEFQNPKVSLGFLLYTFSELLPGSPQIPTQGQALSVSLENKQASEE